MAIRLHIQPARNYRSPDSIARNRVHLLGLLLVVIGVGLFLRSRFCSAPPFVEKYGGDALWALVVFLGMGFLFPRAATFTLALSALTISWGVEFFQLYHAPWLDALRATLPGKLILGSTFNPPDLAAYVVGVATGVMLESIRSWRRI